MNVEDTVEISIIIPVYNEQGNLPFLFDELKGLTEIITVAFEVIAVDDCSNDGSREILDEASRQLPFLQVTATKANLGMGAAIIRGVAISKGRYIFWAMADLSDRLSDIIATHEKLREGFDLVVASRAMQGGSYGGLLGWKSFLSHSYSWFASRLFGIPIGDVTNAFRGMKRELFFALELKSQDFTLSPEMTLKAHRHGAKITEIPTVYRYRQTGISSFKVMKMGIQYASLFALRFLPAPKETDDDL